VIFNILLSDDLAAEAYAGNLNNASRAIEVLAKETAKPYVFSSQFHIFALASVIGQPIFSVYQDIPGSIAIKKALHGVCNPRQRFQEDDSLGTVDPVHIMWTRVTHSQLRGWRPNHFTPIVPFSTYTDSSSFAEVVKIGTKRMQHFAFAKGEKSQREPTEKKQLKVPMKTFRNEQLQYPISYNKQQQQSTIPNKLQQQQQNNSSSSKNNNTNNSNSSSSNNNNITNNSNKNSSNNGSRRQRFLINNGKIYQFIVNCSNQDPFLINSSNSQLYLTESIKKQQFLKNSRINH
jgi:hypothetical protein